MSNRTSTYIAIIKEICKERGIYLRSFSHDWVLLLEKAGKRMRICGYQYPLNNAASEWICNDKCALFEVLAADGIPAVEHRLIMSPASAHHVGCKDSYAELFQWVARYGKAVLKPNCGSGGKNVIFAESEDVARFAADEIFKTERALAVSPYVKILNEYRAVVLDGNVQILFEKRRPAVKGNGKDSVYTLAKNSGLKLDIGIIDGLYAPEFVPADGTEVFLGWRHNLASGAIPSEEIAEETADAVTSLALRAAKSADMRFVSVDVVRTEAGYAVLELNSGVMTEHYAQSSPKRYARAKALYAAAIETYFSEREEG